MLVVIDFNFDSNIRFGRNSLYTEKLGNYSSGYQLLYSALLRFYCVGVNLYLGKIRCMVIAG
jgi:hypothetical protein